MNNTYPQLMCMSATKQGKRSAMTDALRTATKQFILWLYNQEILSLAAADWLIKNLRLKGA